MNTRIEINPKVMAGKPVVKGTRIPVDVMVRQLSQGTTEKEILEDYPNLKKEDIRTASSFA